MQKKRRRHLGIGANTNCRDDASCNGDSRCQCCELDLLGLLSAGRSHGIIQIAASWAPTPESKMFSCSGKVPLLPTEA